MSKMIRITEATQVKLEALRKITGKSQQALLEKAVNILSREAFLQAANEAYKNLRNDPVVWQEESVERALWEKASLQDLIKDIDHD